MLGSFLLAFAISFDEILVTNFTSGSVDASRSTCSARLRRYIDPSANAVATILLLIPWFASLASAFVLRRSGGTTSREEGADMGSEHASPTTTAAAGALTIEGVTKRFGDSVVAVDDLSLDLPAGSFFSLLGPSGCGKTTLLRMIAGLESPTRAACGSTGPTSPAMPPERRPFNLVFQRYALFPHFTVEDNVAFGLTTNRATRPPRDESRAGWRRCSSSSASRATGTASRGSSRAARRSASRSRGR